MSWQETETCHSGEARIAFGPFNPLSEVKEDLFPVAKWGHQRLSLFHQIWRKGIMFILSLTPPKNRNFCLFWASVHSSSWDANGIDLQAVKFKQDIMRFTWNKPKYQIPSTCSFYKSLVHIFFWFTIFTYLIFMTLQRKFRLTKSSFKIADDIKDYYFIRPRPTV